MAAEKDSTKKAEAAEAEPKGVYGLYIRPAAVYVLDVLWTHWFLFGLGVAIGVAAAVPAVAKTHGYIRSEWSIKYGAVIVIFLLSGMGLKTRVLLNAAAAWRLHLVTQVLSLVVMPAVGCVLALFIRYGIGKGMWLSPRLNKDLVTGFIIAQCTSTTASTNVVFTASSGGNESLALVNAVIGNLIGIFLTPAWLVAFLSAQGDIPYGKVIVQVIETILAPLVVGQVIQYKFPDQVKKAQKYINFNKTGSMMILLLVWATFSNQFAKDVKADAGSIIAVTLLNLAVFFIFAIMSLVLPIVPPFQWILGSSVEDAIAMSMCVSTKTVALGIPIISAVYGSSKKAGLYSLPLIIYHAEQILIGSILTAPLKRWKERKAKAAEAAGAGKDEEKGDGKAAGEDGAANGGARGDSATELGEVTSGPSRAAGDEAGSGEARGGAGGAGGGDSTAASANGVAGDSHAKEGPPPAAVSAEAVEVEVPIAASDKETASAAATPPPPAAAAGGS